MVNDNQMTHILLIGLAVIILLILVSQYNANSNKTAAVYQEETFIPENTSYGEDGPESDPSKLYNSQAKDNSQEGVVQASEGHNSDMYKPVSYEDSKSVSQCAPKDKLSVEDLLPKDAANSKWAQVVPAGQGDVDNKNFLTAGYLTGVNTVGPSLRNANMQLRSDPPIERMNVGPWNQSTIEYDASRKFFEIGGGDC
jgi:hypothetical protein